MMGEIVQRYFCAQFYIKVKLQALLMLAGLLTNLIPQVAVKMNPKISEEVCGGGWGGGEERRQSSISIRYVFKCITVQVTLAFFLESKLPFSKKMFRCK